MNLKFLLAALLFTPLAQGAAAATAAAITPSLAVTKTNMGAVALAFRFKHKQTPLEIIGVGEIHNGFNENVCKAHAAILTKSLDAQATAKGTTAYLLEQGDEVNADSPLTRFFKHLTERKENLGSVKAYCGDNRPSSVIALNLLSFYIVDHQNNDEPNLKHSAQELSAFWKLNNIVNPFKLLTTEVVQNLQRYTSQRKTSAYRLASDALEELIPMRLETVTDSNSIYDFFMRAHNDKQFADQFRNAADAITDNLGDLSLILEMNTMLKEINPNKLYALWGRKHIAYLHSSLAANPAFVCTKFAGSTDPLVTDVALTEKELTEAVL